ncbi:hypothetical protein CPB86DRAFT_871328 [Serendipita vermifera]|nr:hypothetical protein CPB86DRAFT_830750 [Serendipita vermifera]PVG01307.1 hypothetical protein CPB86DRAFT_871328 [Serendipita vermifera]
MPWNLTSSSEAKGTTVYRIPLEIWEQVLQWSISYPMLPLSDECLPAILLLKHDCEVSQKMEETQKKLRLVCQSWNRIVKRISIQFVYDGDPMTAPIPPFTQRVEFKKDNCLCSIFRIEWEKEFADIKASYPSVEALVMLDSYKEQLHLGRFPNTRVLSIYSFDLDHISSKFPALIRNLSHLRVPLIRSGRVPQGELIFPNLHTLSIDFGGEFYYGNNTQELVPDVHNSDFLNWSLPNLVNLGCFGEVIYDWTSQAIYELIEKFGSTLKGFFMVAYELGLNRIYFPLPRNLWKQCTLLTTLSTSLTNITPYVPPPHGHHLLCLMFCDVDRPQDWQCGAPCIQCELGWSHYDVSASLDMALSWQVDTLQMDISWKQLTDQINNLEPDDLKMIYNLLDQLRQAGQDLMDKYGNSLKSKEGESFAIWIENAQRNWMEATNREDSTSSEDLEAGFRDKEEDTSSNGGEEQDTD